MGEIRRQKPMLRPHRCIRTLGRPMGTCYGCRFLRIGTATQFNGRVRGLPELVARSFELPGRTLTEHDTLSFLPRRCQCKNTRKTIRALRTCAQNRQMTMGTLCLCASKMCAPSSGRFRHFVARPVGTGSGRRGRRGGARSKARRKLASHPRVKRVVGLSCFD